MAKEQRQTLFTGHSSNFSIQEALDDALAQAGHARGGTPGAFSSFVVRRFRGEVGGASRARNLWVDIDLSGAAPR